VGGRLDNCQLIPLTGLLPLVDDPEVFETELRSLDVPASHVRHPVVFARLGRSRSLAVHELAFARALTDRPVKVALPGPYLLTRTMRMECISERAYRSREDLATDIVRVLREEIHFLLAAPARASCSSTSPCSPRSSSPARRAAGASCAAP
jgi:5-methyltetrahydropteroyltriglutamate--homocysteine methyltransferase